MICALRILTHDFDPETSRHRPRASLSPIVPHSSRSGSFRRASLRVYRVATYVVLALGLMFAALVFGIRFVLLPNIDNYRENVAAAISAAAGQNIVLGVISGEWEGFQPRFRVRDVRVHDAQGQPALIFSQVDVVVSELALLRGALKFESLVIEKPDLEIRRDTGGQLWVAGMAMRPGDGDFSSWLLQQGQVVIRDARIVWRDEFRGAPDLALDQVEFRWENLGSRHRFGLTGNPPSAIASGLTLRGEFSDLGAVASKGRLYAELGYVDLSQAHVWLNLPIEVTAGLGALKVWTEFSGGRIQQALADVQLVNAVSRLAPQLPAL